MCRGSLLTTVEAVSATVRSAFRVAEEFVIGRPQDELKEQVVRSMTEDDCIKVLAAKCHELSESQNRMLAEKFTNVSFMFLHDEPEEGCFGEMQDEEHSESEEESEKPPAKRPKKKRSSRKSSAVSSTPAKKGKRCVNVFAYISHAFVKHFKYIFMCEGPKI